MGVESSVMATCSPGSKDANVAVCPVVRPLPTLILRGSLISLSAWAVPQD